jgi:hypothetical protein
MNGDFQEFLKNNATKGFTDDDRLKSAFRDAHSLIEDDELNDLIAGVVSGKISLQDARKQLVVLCEDESSHQLRESCVADGYKLILSMEKGLDNTKGHVAKSTTVDEAVGIIENTPLVGIPLAIMMLFILGDKVATGQRLAEEAVALQRREEAEDVKQDEREDLDRLDRRSKDRIALKKERRLKRDAYRTQLKKENQIYYNDTWTTLKSIDPKGAILNATAVVGGLGTLVASVHALTKGPPIPPIKAS